MEIVGALKWALVAVIKSVVLRMASNTITRLVLSPFMSVALVRTVVLPVASALVTTILYDYVSRKLAQREAYLVDRVAESARAHLARRSRRHDQQDNDGNGGGGQHQQQQQQQHRMRDVISDDEDDVIRIVNDDDDGGEEAGGGYRTGGTQARLHQARISRNRSIVNRT